MESNPSRIPRRISVHPSSTSPLTTRQLYGSGRTGLSDAYHTGEDSVKLESEFQDSDTLPASRRDWAFGERESCDSAWKRTTVPLHSGSIERPWSGNLLGSRLLPTSAQFPSAVNCESERTPGVHSRLHNQQQDRDSKRPKLSYSGCASISGVRSNSGLNMISDSSWKYGQVPRSSSLVLGSSDSELMGERRNPERRTNPSASAFVDYSPRNGNMNSSSYPQNRADSSHAQGARPKESVLGPLRLNSSMNRQLPSEHQSSLFTRDSDRNSQRPSTSREIDSPQLSTQSEYTQTVTRDGLPTSTTESLSPSLQQTSVTEAPTDTEGRRTTRQLLSRLASSMSSTFFSRRSSQESLNARALDSEDVYVGPRVQNSIPPSVNAVSTPNAADVGSSEPSQGLGFLRGRRWCLPTGSQSRSVDSETRRYRSEDSETRTTSSWLSSSFRNRCTPLFSRRRREGRDETARSTSDAASRSYPLRRESRPVDSSESAQHLNRAASAVSPGLHPFFRREYREVGPSVEAADNVNRAASVALPVPESASTTTSIPDASQSRRNSGRSGVLTGSFYRFAVPPGLGSSPNNLMITVDVLSSGRTSADGQEEKSQSSSRDPEKLKKIQESLLLEDSEDEGDLCRICQMGASTSTNPLIEPCKCTGSLQYIHQECMKKWLQAKINSGSRLEAVTTCELCKEKLQLDLKDFDVRELYRAHHSERVDYEFLSSGLYLVVLLHLCEQRFTNLLGAANEASTRDRFTSLARTLQAHLADLETSEDDSEGDGES